MKQLLVFFFFSYFIYLLIPFFYQGCTLVALNHEDIYSSMEKPALILHLEYLADILMKTEPLATGLATDVHGQVALFYF